MATIEVKHNYSLEELSLQNPEMAKKVHEITKEVLNRARNAMRDKVRDVSTKEAYRAVRKSVYTKIFGGNVNIASTRFRSGKTAPLPPESPRKRSKLRGGNRMLRSDRTKALLTYWGADRGFILRFQNSGTPGRIDNGTRFVGRIGANDWFTSSGQKEMEQAAQLFDELMQQVIDEKFNK